MIARSTILVIPSVLLGLAAGAGGTYAWLSSRHDTRAATQPAAISLSRDSCCAAPKSEHAHDAEDEHEHEHEGETDCVRMDAEAIRRFGIEVAKAGPGMLEQTLTLPGEVVLNADRVAHIVPRVSGMVREIHKKVGDHVQAGDVLAVLDSRELAEAKAADLTAEARLTLAESNLQRVEALWKDKLTADKQYHEAQQSLEEARIAHRESMGRLYALGLPHEQVAAVAEQDQSAFARYEMTAPFAGVIIEKNATLGEVHDSTSNMFVLADLDTVWVDVTVYAQQMDKLKNGMKVRIQPSSTDAKSAASDLRAEGNIVYVSPTLREATRTGIARVAIPNREGIWRPGMFVTADIVLVSESVPVLVPAEAVQVVEEQPVVFLAGEGDFDKRPVTLGQSNRWAVQIVSGLQAGESFVSKGAFILKAELSKGTGGHEH